MFEIRGLDEAMRKLRRLEQNARGLEGPHNVNVTNLLTPAFMRRYTQVESFEALLEKGGFKVESQADFDALEGEKWETLIRSHTSFNCWQSLLEKAAAEYASKQLMKGV